MAGGTRRVEPRAGQSVDDIVGKAGAVLQFRIAGERVLFFLARVLRLVRMPALLGKAIIRTRIGAVIKQGTNHGRIALEYCQAQGIGYAGWPTGCRVSMMAQQHVHGRDVGATSSNESRGSSFVVRLRTG